MNKITIEIIEPQIRHDDLFTLSTYEIDSDVIRIIIDNTNTREQRLNKTKVWGFTIDETQKEAKLIEILTDQYLIG